MKFKTFSIRGTVREIKKVIEEIGIPQSLLIRMAIDDLLKDKEKLKKKVFSRKGE